MSTATTDRPTAAPDTTLSPDMREFLMVIRRAMLMVCKWIEKRCEVPA